MPSGKWSGHRSIRGPNESVRMMLLSFSLVGLTITWGIEMTYCTPYLLRLGLSKSKTSLAWLAGPLSGLIMVPIVGAITDQSTSRWGRRRPFMVWGSVMVSVGLLLLGWTEEITGLFITDETMKKDVTLVAAVISIYVVDFAINAVAACSRSLIVDTLPRNQQQAGSAWASRMSAAGHVIGYVIGSLDMVRLTGSLFSGSQFKIMVFIAIVTLLGAISVTCWSVSERRLMPSASSDSISISVVLAELFHRTINLPPRIQSICWIQFWSWIGWFPFLFYCSTWVGETYYRYEHPASASESESHDALGNVGRLGSLSLVIMSLIQLSASVLLPYLVESPGEGPRRSSFTPRPPRDLPKTLERCLSQLLRLQPNMVTTWMIGELFFAVVMMCAPLARSLRFAITLVAAAGVPWCISCWAPFAEMGIEINKLTGAPGDQVTAMESDGYSAVRAEDVLDADNTEIEMKVLHRRSPSAGLGLLRRDSAPTEHETAPTGDLAGVYLGVLNVYSTLPQFVGTFISWVVFSILEPGKENVSDDDPEHHKWLNVKKDAPNAIAICLFIGACCAAVSAEVARRLRLRDQAQDASFVR